MSILADRIEQFILSKLLEDQQDQEPMLILQRNELADELDCAPSQISYVLSTRFSNDRGFIVESRRGLGGFIRITRLEVDPAAGTNGVLGEAAAKTNGAEAGSEESSAEGKTSPPETGSLTVQPRRRQRRTTIGDIDNVLFRMLRDGVLSKREAALMHEAFTLIYESVAAAQQEKAVQKLYTRLTQIVKED